MTKAAAAAPEGDREIPAINVRQLSPVAFRGLWKD
jgi:hypothetical protein